MQLPNQKDQFKKMMKWVPAMYTPTPQSDDMSFILYAVFVYIECGILIGRVYLLCGCFSISNFLFWYLFISTYSTYYI